MNPEAVALSAQLADLLDRDGEERDDMEPIIDRRPQTESKDYLICREADVDEDVAKAVDNAVAAKHRLADAMDAALDLTVARNEPMCVLRYEVTRLATFTPALVEGVES